MQKPLPSEGSPINHIKFDKGNIIQINKCQDILTFPSEY